MWTESLCVIQRTRYASNSENSREKKDGEIIAVYCKGLMKHNYVLGGQNAEFLVLHVAVSVATARL